MLPSTQPRRAFIPQKPNTSRPRCQVSPNIGVGRHRLLYGKFAYRWIPEYVPVGFHSRPFLYWRMADPIEPPMNPVVFVVLNIARAKYRQTRRGWLMCDPGVYVQWVSRAFVTQAGSIADVNRIGSCACLTCKHQGLEILFFACDGMCAGQTDAVRAA